MTGKRAPKFDMPASVGDRLDRPSRYSRPPAAYEKFMATLGLRIYHITAALA